MAKKISWLPHLCVWYPSFGGAHQLLTRHIVVFRQTSILSSFRLTMMQQDAIIEVIHVVWEITKLLLLGMAMLVVMVIFIALIIVFVAQPFPLCVQIVGMIGLLFMFAGIIFELMLCAGNDENEDSDIEVDNNNNNGSRNHVVVVIDDRPGILDEVLDHAFDVGSDDDDEDDDDGYDSITDDDKTKVDADCDANTDEDNDDDDDDSSDDGDNDDYINIRGSCGVTLCDCSDGFLD